MVAVPDHRCRWLGGVVAVLLCATGCDAGLMSTGPGPGACSWLSQQATSQPGAATSDTVVLIDISASFWPARGRSDPLPDGPVQIATNELLTSFDSPGTRLVSVGTFDGSSATIDWKLGGVALPVPYGNGQAIQAQQQAASSCLGGAVSSAVRAAPQVAGTDEMAALAAAGDQLQGVSPSRARVVLITDGLSNVGCLNLSQVLSRGESASTVIADCPEHAGLAALRGVSLRLFGVGFEAASPPLTSAQQAWVVNYWRDMCGALRVTTSASCVVPAQTEAVRTSSVSRPGDAAITFPTVPDGARSIPVPADLLFAFDSATISPAGQSYLDLLLQQIKGRTITQVIGHTDAVGTATYNLRLSQRRADAVEAFLASHGFTGVAATGVGESQPACSPQYTPSGTPIEPCMARDRRVQIILGG